LQQIGKNGFAKYYFFDENAIQYCARIAPKICPDGFTGSCFVLKGNGLNPPIHHQGANLNEIGPIHLDSLPTASRALMQKYSVVPPTSGVTGVQCESVVNATGFPHFATGPW
jgi:hypothetical protein